MAYTRNRNGNSRNGNNGRSNDRQEEKKKPVADYAGNSNGSRIECSIWDNEIAGDDGPVTVFAVSIKRSYNDGDEWKHTTSMRMVDIPVLQFLLAKCYEWIHNEQERR